MSDYSLIGDKYAFVAKNVDYLPPLKNYADPQRWDSEGGWSYDWDDYAAALLVVLPPGVGASDGFPRVHSRGVGTWNQLMAGSGGSQGFLSMAARTASSA